MLMKKHLFYSLALVASLLSATTAQAQGKQPITPDWHTFFETQAEFNLFTVIDANGDGTTWTYRNFGVQTYAMSEWNRNSGNDDWLITPPFQMTANRSYTLTFSAYNRNRGYLNSFEVKYGNDTTVEAMTKTLVETTTPDNGFNNWVRYTVTFRPDSDGLVYIGFHDNTATSQRQLCIDSIYVVKGVVDTAVDSVAGLTVTPGERGALTAAISFVAPTKTITGDAITAVDSFQVLRDGELVATLPRAVAGSTVTCTDTLVPTHGNHTYSVVPYVGGEFGRTASVEAFVGQDAPADPEYITLSDNGSTILATWPAVSETGATGHFVDPSRVSMTFYQLVTEWIGTDPGDSVTTSPLGVTQCEIPINPDSSTNVNGVTQALFHMAGRLNGDGGKSHYHGTSTIVVGPSITLPFKESQQGGNSDNGFTWYESEVNQRDSAALWMTSKDLSVDGDGGCLLWAPHTTYYSINGINWSVPYTIIKGDSANINMPKVSLRGSTNPKLYFSVYAKKNMAARLQVRIMRPDYKEDSLNIQEFNFAANEAEGWKQYDVDLKKYVNDKFIIVKFYGISDGDSTYMALDNINIFDQQEKNLAANFISGPNTIVAGKSGNITVRVQNYGASTAEAYTVNLYANEKVISSTSVSEPLPVLGIDTLQLKLPVAINTTDSVLSVKAVVEYDGDLVAADNTTDTLTIKIRKLNYSPATNLTGNADGAKVNLSWSKPTLAAPTTKTEDFESYTPFETEIGDWTTVCGSTGVAAPFWTSISYPGQGTNFAFEVFNPNAITDAFDVVENNKGFAPHSGNQYAGSPNKVDEATGQTFIAADNWLISPTLSGNSQTITLYALNIANRLTRSYTRVFEQKFDILYSTAGTDTASFVLLKSCTANGRTSMNNGANWTEFTADIPEGAHYFAIHQNSVGENFLFGIDDITYEAGDPGQNDTIVGYNIYRDGQLVATVEGTTLTYTDADAELEKEHVYNVTALYRNFAGETNESGFSNDYSVLVTGIEGIDADQTANSADKLYDLSGRRVVKTAKGKVYVGKGKKFVGR